MISFYVPLYCDIYLNKLSPADQKQARKLMQSSKTLDTELVIAYEQALYWLQKYNYEITKYFITVGSW